MLVGFLVSFGFIRVSARLGRSPRFDWWPGKGAKAAHRFRQERRSERVKEWFRDAVGGQTNAVYHAKLAGR